MDVSSLADHVRHLPIYVVVDVSAGTAGLPIKAINEALHRLADKLWEEPWLIDAGLLSLITFGGDAQELIPPSPVANLEIPDLFPGESPGVRLGAALALLDASIGQDKPRMPRSREDLSPIVLLLLAASPTDEWAPVLFSLLDQPKRRPWFTLVTLHEQVGLGWLGSHPRVNVCQRGLAELPAFLESWVDQILVLLSISEELEYERDLDLGRVRAMGLADTRGLPVFLLIDSSGDMQGEWHIGIKLGLQTFANTLSTLYRPAKPPVRLGIIWCGGNGEAMLPVALEQCVLGAATGGLPLGGALRSLIEAADEQAQQCREGLTKALAIVLLTGSPTDEWEGLACQARSSEHLDLLAVGGGPDADMNVLYTLTDTVIECALEAPEIVSLFQWMANLVSDVVIVQTRGVVPGLVTIKPYATDKKEHGGFPPLPSDITIVL